MRFRFLRAPECNISCDSTPWFPLGALAASRFLIRFLFSSCKQPALPCFKHSNDRYRRYLINIQRRSTNKNRTELIFTVYRFTISRFSRDTNRNRLLPPTGKWGVPFTRSRLVSSWQFSPRRRHFARQQLSAALLPLVCSTTVSTPSSPDRLRLTKVHRAPKIICKLPCRSSTARPYVTVTTSPPAEHVRADNFSINRVPSKMLNTDWGCLVRPIGRV